MEKMKFNVTLSVSTMGTRKEAQEDIERMLDLRELENEEYNLTRIDAVEIDGSET